MVFKKKKENFTFYLFAHEKQTGHEGNYLDNSSKKVLEMSS